MAVNFHYLPFSARADTDESVCLSFDVPPELYETFRHVPGQHVVLRAEIDGQDVRRSYSICTNPSDGTFSVGIKAIRDGVFSTWANTRLMEGGEMEVLPPIGQFCHHPDPEVANTYVALVAGSGITPVLSILGSILEIESSSTYTLVYGNKRATSVMFLNELKSLKDKYPERFRIINVLSREVHQVPLFSGRIDAEKLGLLASSLISVPEVSAWFICGPMEMVEVAGETLTNLGVGEDRLHSELFFDERIEVLAEASEMTSGSVSLEFALDGRSSKVSVDPSGPPLLDYARSVRPEVPFACKGGMCATCKARVLQGEVTMEKNYALSRAEVEDGYVLSCQAHPLSDDVSITYDVQGGSSG